MRNTYKSATSNKDGPQYTYIIQSHEKWLSMTAWAWLFIHIIAWWISLNPCKPFFHWWASWGPLVIPSGILDLAALLQCSQTRNSVSYVCVHLPRFLSDFSKFSAGGYHDMNAFWSGISGWNHQKNQQFPVVKYILVHTVYCPHMSLNSMSVSLSSINSSPVSSDLTTCILSGFANHPEGPEKTEENLTSFIARHQG